MARRGRHYRVAKKQYHQEKVIEQRKRVNIRLIIALVAVCAWLEGFIVATLICKYNNREL